VCFSKTGVFLAAENTQQLPCRLAESSASSHSSHEEAPPSAVRASEHLSHLSMAVAAPLPERRDSPDRAPQVSVVVVEDGEEELREDGSVDSDT
jgi:hypothetical protein